MEADTPASPDSYNELPMETQPEPATSTAESSDSEIPNSLRIKYDTDPQVISDLPKKRGRKTRKF